MTISFWVFARTLPVNVPDELVAGFSGVKEQRALFRTKAKRALEAFEDELAVTFPDERLAQSSKRPRIELHTTGLAAVQDVIESLQKTNPKAVVSLIRNPRTSKPCEIHVALGEVLQATFKTRVFKRDWEWDFEITEGSASPPPMRVSAEAPGYLVFEKITCHILGKLSELAFEPSEKALYYLLVGFLLFLLFFLWVQRLCAIFYLFYLSLLSLHFLMQDWLASYESLFRVKCEGCGKFLQLDSEEFKFLPPTLRIYQKGKYLVLHESCSPKS